MSMTQYHHTQSSPEYARQPQILSYKYWFEMRQNKEEHYAFCIVLMSLS